MPRLPRSLCGRASSPSLLKLSPIVLVILLLLSSRALAALEYAFSAENPTVCFHEEVSESEGVNEQGKIDHYVVGSYTWQPHPLNANSRFMMSFQSPDEVTLENVIMEANTDGSPKTFAFKAVVDTPGPYMLCVTLSQNSAVPADDPIYISFDVDQATHKSVVGHNEEAGEEEVAIALREQYRRKRRGLPRDPGEGGGEKADGEPTREVVDGMEVFVYRDYGNQVKSILQSPAYLKELGHELNQLEIEVRRKTGVLAEDVEKEGRMRQTSESTFNRVWVCAVMVIFAITLVVTWQFSLLKKTLKRKKKI